MRRSRLRKGSQKCKQTDRGMGKCLTFLILVDENLRSVPVAKK